MQPLAAAGRQGVAEGRYGGGRVAAARQGAA